MSTQDTYDIVGSETVFDGKIITVRVDDVRMTDGSVAKREIVGHPGAVVVVALDDEGSCSRKRTSSPTNGMCCWICSARRG